MNHLTFKWDDKKNASNQKKHGISFDEARTIFTDQFARLIADPDHSSNEDRFILMGTRIQSRLLMVCHCVSDSIRIIFARKADKLEREIYEGHRHA